MRENVNGITNKQNLTSDIIEIETIHYPGLPECVLDNIE